MTQKLLEEVFGHPLVGKPLGDRMPQKVRVDALGDFGILRSLFDDLLDAPGRIVAAAGRWKDIPRPAIAQVEAQLVHEALQNRDVPCLPSLPADADLTLPKRDLLRLKLGEKRNAHPGLQERPEHQALPGALFVGGGEKPANLFGRQAVHTSLLSLRGREAHFFSGLGDQVLRLVVRVAAVSEDLRHAPDVALAIVVRTRRGSGIRGRRHRQMERQLSMGALNKVDIP